MPAWDESRSSAPSPDRRSVRHGRAEALGDGTRLGFGDGERARVAAERPVTAIKAGGLSLPTPGVARADYDQAERLGVATLKPIAAYAMRLIAGDRCTRSCCSTRPGSSWPPATAGG